MTWFWVGVETDLVFLWVVFIGLMSVWEIEVVLISVQGSELTRFLCGGRNCLVLVPASKFCFWCWGI